MMKVLNALVSAAASLAITINAPASTVFLDSEPDLVTGLVSFGASGSVLARAADDFVTPAGSGCVLVETVRATLFTNIDFDLSDVHVSIYADDAGVPGDEIATTTATAMAPTGTVPTSNPSLPGFEFTFDNLSIVLDTGTRYWVSALIEGTGNITETSRVATSGNGVVAGEPAAVINLFIGVNDWTPNGDVSGGFDTDLAFTVVGQVFPALWENEVDYVSGFSNVTIPGIVSSQVADDFVTPAGPGDTTVECVRAIILAQTAPTPAQVTMAVHADDAGLPGAVLLQTTATNVRVLLADVPQFPGFGSYECRFDGLGLVLPPGTRYWVSTNVEGPTPTFFATAGDGVVTGEPAAGKGDGYGPDWTTLSATGGGFDTDLAFAVYGTVPAPSITAQPQSALLDPCNSPSSLTLTVSASGGGTLTYQWRRDGEDIPGATSASLTILSPEPSDTGYYDCVVGAALATDVATTQQAIVAFRPSTCPGDLDGDCTTGLADFTILASDFGCAGE
jgi:hypothetical protein